MHPNSVALLIWYVLDRYRYALENEQYEFLEEMLQLAKKNHYDKVGYRKRMTHQARISDCHDLLDDIEQEMKGMA